MNQLDELLADIHTKTAKHLLARLESGEATAPEVMAAIKLLQHNNITCVQGYGESGKTLDRIKDLPFLKLAEG